MRRIFSERNNPFTLFTAIPVAQPALQPTQPVIESGTGSTPTLCETCNPFVSNFWTETRDYLAMCAPFAGQIGLDKNVFDHVPMHIREPAVDAVVVERELLVVDAEEVQDGGVDVVDFGWVFAVGGFVAEVVAGAVADPAFNTAAS